MANNGKTSNELAQNMLDAFDLLAKAEVNSAQFDKTVVAIIVSCEDAASGRYRVQYQDSIFNAYSSALDVTYTKGTSVQVRIPNNDFSGRKIIIGTCEENGIEYGIVVEDPLLRYEMIGSDCIMNGKEEQGMSTYWTEQKNNIVLYDRSNDVNKIGLDTQMVWDNIKQGDSLILGATIRTDIDDEQRFSGNYGIKYTLTFENTTMVNSETPTIDRYYIVDIDKMSGDPYSYDNGTDQLIPFDVDSEHFLYISKIELFAKHFPIEKEEEDADIWINNVRFQVANKLSEEEFNGTGLTIVTPEGNYFREKENLSTKRAIAELRIRGKITGNVRKVEYFWFIEDLRVNRSSNLGYHKYAGRGWRCLNEYNVTDGDVAKDLDGKEYYTEIRKVQYVTGKDTLQVKKDTTKARQTKYKCVAVYNGTVLEKEFIFTNYEIEDNLQIICDGNPDFIDSIGKVTLTCLPSDQAEYAWARVDNEGGFEPLSETKDLNDQYHDNIKLRDDLLIALENKTKPNNESTKAELEKYQSWIDSFNTKTRLENNQMINIQAASVFQQVVYKCQVFDEDGISLGIAAQRLTNTLKADGEEQSGNLIIKNGNQVYKYNAKGVSPCDEQWEEPQVILPLSFILRNAEGLEIPETAIKNTDVSWIVPTKNTMIANVEGTFANIEIESFESKDEFPETGEQDKYYFAKDTEIKYIWKGSSYVEYSSDSEYQVYNGKTLGYTIGNKYYSQRDNNEIQLQVKYQGMLYIATTNLYFVKDGENGTNGTEYVLKIVPQGTIGRLKTVGPNQSGTWFHAQLWKNGEKVFDTQINQNSSNARITWSMVGDNRATHNIMVSQIDTIGTWTSVGYSQYSPIATDIVKATMEYNGLTIVATQPIIYAPEYMNNEYQVSLKKGTGFTHVVYSEDGLTPDYDSTIPFELEVKKMIKGQWGDITGHNTLNYEWSTVGNLTFKNGYTEEMSQVMFEPTGYFNSEEKGNAVICQLWENTHYIGTFRIPIHFMLNRYGHSAINEWDGNSIQLTADGNTMLLAPQGGFGKKEKDNSYTGLLMGTIKEYYPDGGAPTDHTGMFAYNKGNRTMFLNAETGAANFGQVGSAQIVIDPAGEDRDSKEKHARIYSGDFYKNYDNKTGLPINYETSNENTGHDPNNPEAGKGMLIDLTEPEIRWGNKNFSVDKNGYITAQGGGKIAGWKINDYRIDSIDNGIKPTDTGNTGMSSVYTEDAAGVTQWDVKVPASAGTNKNKAIAFWAGGTGTKGKFHVAHDGYVRMQDATIGSGNENSLIYIGKSGDNSSIYTFGHPTLKTTANGFYIGVDGFSLGSQFKVTKEGTVTIGRGAVDGSNNGRYWTIEAQSRDHSRIYYNKSSRDDANDGVYIGTDGFGLGKSYNYNGTTIPNLKQSLQGTFSKFTVTNAGRLYAQDAILAGTIYSKEGQIAGWHIREKKIETGNGTGEGIEIGSDGHIKSYNDKWKIEKNGTATFKKIRITTDGDNYNDNTIVINANNKFKVTAAGKITATSGSIAGWTINDTEIKGGNVTFQKDGNLKGTNWYINADGSSKFGNLSIDAAGNITANGGTFNDITTNNMTAQGGTFNNITANTITANSATIDGATISRATITDSCTVPASTVTGVLSTNNIPNLNANKITTGTLSGDFIRGGTITGTKIDGVEITGGSIAGSSIDAMSVGADVIGVNTIYGNYSIGNRIGQSVTQWVMTGWGNTNTSGGVFEPGKLTVGITFHGKDFQFTGGILTDVSGDKSATLTLKI